MANIDYGASGRGVKAAGRINKRAGKTAFAQDLFGTGAMILQHAGQKAKQSKSAWDDYERGHEAAKGRFISDTMEKTLEGEDMGRGILDITRETGKELPQRASWSQDFKDTFKKGGSKGFFEDTSRGLFGTRMPKGEVEIGGKYYQRENLSDYGGMLNDPRAIALDDDQRRVLESIYLNPQDKPEDRGISKMGYLREQGRRFLDKFPQMRERQLAREGYFKRDKFDRPEVRELREPSVRMGRMPLDSRMGTVVGDPLMRDDYSGETVGAPDERPFSDVLGSDWIDEYGVSSDDYSGETAGQPWDSPDYSGETVGQPEQRSPVFLDEDFYPNTPTGGYSNFLDYLNMYQDNEYGVSEGAPDERPFSDVLGSDWIDEYGVSSDDYSGETVANRRGIISVGRPEQIGAPYRRQGGGTSPLYAEWKSAMDSYVK